MRSFMFVFIGVTESDSDADINIVKRRLEEALEKNAQPIKFVLKGQLLTLSLSKPDFRFYISFEKNDRKTLQDFQQMAEDFELPWDKKPVDYFRLQKIYTQLEEDGWIEYKPFYNIGYSILKEMEKFKNVLLFTIPSMG